MYMCMFTCMYIYVSYMVGMDINVSINIHICIFPHTQNSSTLLNIKKVFQYTRN